MLGTLRLAKKLWIDIAYQLAGDQSQRIRFKLQSVPPGTETLNRVFSAAKAPVLILLMRFELL